MSPIVLREGVPASGARLLAGEKQRNRLLVWGTLVAVLLGLPLCGWAYLTFDPHPSMQLRRGSVLSLQGVWSNSPEPVPLGPNWMQRLTPFVPPPIREDLDWRTSVPPAWSNRGLSTTVFHHSADAQYIPMVLDDPHGCRFYPSDMMCTYYGKGLSLSTEQFALAPRSEAKFQLRAHLADFGGGVSEKWLPVVNRVPVAMPRWDPEALPSEKKDGGFRARLLSVTAGMSGGNPARTARPDEEPHVVLRVQCPAGWQPVGVRVSDSSGAISSQTVRVLSNGEVVFPLSLCRRQSAYKMRLEFSRVQDDAAVPDDRWKVNGVPLDLLVSHEVALGEKGLLFNLTTYSAGMTATQTAVAQGWLRFAPEGWRFRIHTPRLKDGRFVQVLPARYEDGLQRFDLPLTTVGKQTDFTVEGFRSRFLEWKVKPTWTSP